MTGENITFTAQQMVKLANETQEPVTAKFNDIELVANPGDDASVVVDYFSKESDRRYAEWANSDEGKKALAESEVRQRQAAEVAAQPLATFSLERPRTWATMLDKNTDPYGSAIMRYAARWASLMEERMTQGSSLTEIAHVTSHEADLEGITGFMYGAAVSILAEVWTHGEELRRWHNLETQIGHEGEEANEQGGVLNPALLRMTPRLRVDEQEQ